jgi:K+-sensing histidine kinase KdpD
LLNKNLDEDKSKVFAERILDSGYEILHYFQNIMDLSEMESGMISVNPVRFDMNQSFYNLVGEFAERFQAERDIKINFSEFEHLNHYVIETDEFLFKRVIGNIIELIQMTIGRGEIYLSYIETDRNQVKIFLRGEAEEPLNPVDLSFQLQDEDMKGIDPDSVEYLTYKATAGLCELLNGSFRLERKYDKGILFSVTIPGNMKNKPNENR